MPHRLVLSFVVIIDASLAGGMESVALDRSDLARGGATAAPREIAFTQVDFSAPDSAASGSSTPSSTPSSISRRHSRDTQGRTRP